MDATLAQDLTGGLGTELWKLVGKVVEGVIIISQGEGGRNKVGPGLEGEVDRREELGRGEEVEPGTLEDKTEDREDKVEEEEKDIIKVKEDKVGARTGLTIITEEQTKRQDSHQHSPQHSPQASLQARQQASVLEMSCRHVLMCALGSLPGCLERV